MKSTPKYAAEKTDPLKEAEILIRRYGANKATEMRIINDLGIDEDMAHQIIQQHKISRYAETKAYFKDKIKLIFAGLMLGIIAGFFLFLSAPQAALAGTLPFIIMVWIGIGFFFKNRR